MLLPKRVKYRRVHRGRLTGKAYRGSKVTYGDFGLQSLEPVSYTHLSTGGLRNWICGIWIPRSPFIRRRGPHFASSAQGGRIPQR